jgi:hypothetical protein
MRLSVFLITFSGLAWLLNQTTSPAQRFPESVSILQLIATPDQFDGKQVQVVGFLRLEFEGNALYLHKEDFDEHIYKDGVWLNIDPGIKGDAQKLNMHYIAMVGVFNARAKGHRSMMSGSLDHIKELYAWPPDIESKKP